MRRVWHIVLELDKPLNKLTVPSEGADVLQLAMARIDPVTAYVMLRNYTRLMPGDWIAQTAANSAVGQYVIGLAKLAGLKTLNIVRREEAADEVRKFGGDLVLVQSENLHEQVKAALGDQKLSLVLDSVGSGLNPLAGSVRDGCALVCYATKGEPPAVPILDLIFRGVSLYGFYFLPWVKTAPCAEVLEVHCKMADLIAAGALSAKIDRTYPLDQFKEAFARAEQPHSKENTS